MKSNRYFRHDWGARHDPKMLRMVRMKGAAAKAVYWDLIEMLFEEGGKLPLDAIEDVSFLNRLKGSDIAKFVVFDSGLFAHDEAFFWSERQQREELRIKQISEKRSDAGKVGGQANAKQMLSKTEANAKQNGYNRIDKIYKIDKEKDVSKDTYKKKDGDAGASLPENGVSGDLKPQDDNFLISEFDVENTPQQTALLTAKQCDDIIALWNATVKSTGANLSRVSAMTEARRDKIRVRWREFARVGDPAEVYKTILAKTCDSVFLQGGSGKSTFKATFDWVFTNDKNWVKIYEGNYDDVKPDGGSLSGITDRSGGIVKVNDYWKNNDFSDVVENEEDEWDRYKKQKEGQSRR